MGITNRNTNIEIDSYDSALGIGVFKIKLLLIIQKVMFPYFLIARSKTNYYN